MDSLASFTALSWPWYGTACCLGLIQTWCHQVDIILVKDGILGEGSSFLCLPLHPRKLLFGMLPLFLDKIMQCTQKVVTKTTKHATFFFQYRLPWDSPLTWVIAAFAIDFCYYWVHRSAHGKSLLLVVLFWLCIGCITCVLLVTCFGCVGPSMVSVWYLSYFSFSYSLVLYNFPQNQNINWSCILQKSMFSGPRTRSQYCLQWGWI